MSRRGPDRLDLALFICAAALHASALWPDQGGWGGRDWDHAQTELLHARRSLLSGELPLWVPWRGGGQDGWADPGSQWASPLGLLALLLGVHHGPRALLALAAGGLALGTSRLLAELRVDAGGRALAALLLSCAPPLGLFAAGGIPSFTVGLLVLPWLVLLFLRGAAGALAGGALLALCLYAGDVNHFVLHTLFLALVAGGLALLRRDPRPLLQLVLVGASALLFSAPKVVPAFLLFRTVPREVDPGARGALTLDLLGNALLHRESIRWVERPRHEFVALGPDGRLTPLALLDGPPSPARHGRTDVDWIDTSIYMGPLGLLLAGLGALVLLRGRGPPRHLLLAVLATSLPLLWLGWGANAWLDAWALLHRVPLLAALRSPARLGLYAFFALTLAAGLGLAVVRRRVALLRSARTGRLVVAAALVLLLLDVHPPCRWALRAAFVEPRLDLPAPRPPGALATTLAPWPVTSTVYGAPTAPWVAAGWAVANRRVDLPLPLVALPRGHPLYRGEAFLLAPEAGRVGPLVPGGRSLKVTYELERPGAVVLNQRAAPGWSAIAPAGAVVRAHEDGRLLVELPPGRGELLLRYWPPGLLPGLGLVACGLPALLLLTRRLATTRPRL